MSAKLLCVVCALAVVLSAEEVKRDKRTIDLVLKGVADAFGFDVVRRISALPARLVEPPKPTFFPPPLSPLPPGSYSRIILSLGQPGANQLVNAQPSVDFSAAPQVLPPLVMPGPPAPPMVAPAPAPPMAPQMAVDMPGSPMAPASKPDMQPPAVPAPAPAPVPAGVPIVPPLSGNVETFEGPTRWSLFSATPRTSESIRRTINFNFNWDRNVQPSQQAIASPAQPPVEPPPSPVQLESQSQSQAPPPPPPQSPLPPAPPQMVLPPPPPQMAPQQHMVPPPPPPSQMVQPPPPPPEMVLTPQVAVPPPLPPQMVLPPPLSPQMVPPPPAPPQMVASPPAMMIPLPAEAPPAPTPPQPLTSEPATKEAPKTTDETSDQKLNFSRIFDFDYNFDDEKDQARKNQDSQQNKQTENFEDQRGRFMESIRAFWDASPWKSNSAPAPEKPQSADLKEGPARPKYEEYDLEPNVEELNAPKSENYKLNVDIPLGEYKGYYERDEDNSEEDRPREKQSKNNSKFGNFDDENDGESRRGKVKYRKVKKVRAGDRKKDREEIQPEVSGIFPKQMHELYKREKSIPWPVPAEGEAHESATKNYYRKYRRDGDRNAKIKRNF